MTLVRRLPELSFRLEDLPRQPWPRRVLLADPGAYDVRYAINPHMLDEAGALRRVDPVRARAQWEALRAAIGELGLEVVVLPAAAELPDLVFCANPVLPLPPGSAAPRGLRARMAAPEREAEVELVGRALGALGYRLEELPVGVGPLEGTGDGLWHPGRALLWAGVGTRSSVGAWEAAAAHIDAPLLVLELTDPDFYHLDTALAPIDEHTCLWYPPAIAPAGRELVRALFPGAIEVPEREARGLLACNAWSPDGRHVLIQRGCEQVVAELRRRALVPLELDTDEFLKSGGSVFCMKLALW